MKPPGARSTALAGLGGQASVEDLETHARSRGAAVIGLLLAFVGAVSALGIRRADATLATICAVSSAALLGTALWAYRTRRHLVPGAFISLNLLVTLALTNLLSPAGPSAALNSLSVLFFVILPPLAMYLLQRNGLIAIGVGVIIYFAAIFAWLNLHPPSVRDPDLGVKYGVVNIALIMGFSISLFYAREHVRMLADLRGAHTALDAARVAEQRRLREELGLAARVQTALLPCDLRVEGLEIAAAMLPADEVGGDYYDVLPIEGGAWLCIGDVAGHGLNARLTMLMMQSAVSTLAQKDPAASPGRVLRALNTTLYENVRRRTERDEHASTTLLRYRRDGTVCFAGAHQEILVLRAAEGCCEVIPTPGPWVGARSSIAGQVTEHHLALADGDVLVLHTDGLTKAIGDGRRRFGLERLEAEILRARGQPVEAIREAILGAVHAVSPVLADDVTLLVARYHAPAFG